MRMSWLADLTLECEHCGDVTPADELIALPWRGRLIVTCLPCWPLVTELVDLFDVQLA